MNHLYFTLSRGPLLQAQRDHVTIRQVVPRRNSVTCLKYTVLATSSVFYKAYKHLNKLSGRLILFQINFHFLKSSTTI